MSKLSEAATQAELNWQAATYYFGSGTRLYHDFELNPRDLLRYAKEDFSQPDKRGLINALSNAKRSIDCCVDKFFVVTGIEQSPNSILNDYLAAPYFNGSIPDTALKMKVVHAMGLAPTRMISKYRKIRNALEHDYKLPLREDVEDGIELAEMFLASIDFALSVFVDHFFIENSTENDEQRADNLSVHFDENDSTFGVSSSEPENDIQITPFDAEFIPLVRAAIAVGKEDGIIEAHRDICYSCNVKYDRSSTEPRIAF